MFPSDSRRAVPRLAPDRDPESIDNSGYRSSIRNSHGGTRRLSGESESRGRSKFIVYCAGVHWDDLPGTDRRLTQALAKQVTVLWVDPPKSIARSRLDAGRPSTYRRLERVAPGIVRLTVIVPPYPERVGIRPFTDLIMARAIKTTVARAPGTAAAMVVTCYEPRFNALPGVKHAYYATDDFTAGADLMKVSARYLRRAENYQISHADVLFAISPEVSDRWAGGSGQVIMLPNGCEPDHYRNVDSAPLPGDVHLSRPIAGVVGQLSARIDISILEAIADEGISLLLVGPRSRDFERERLAALLKKRNVQWVGEKSFAELPSYLRVIDAGLTPYANSAFNRASFPLKTLEYLAAGRASISTSLPAVTRMNTELISVASSPSEFVAKTRLALAEDRTPGLIERRRHLASMNSWDERARVMLGTLGLKSNPRGSEGHGT